MFKQTISDIEFTFTQENNSSYTISGEIDAIKYEGIESFGPIGLKGIEEVKKLIDYTNADCSVGTINMLTILTIPVPFAYETIIIELKQISEVVLLQREVEGLRSINQILSDQNEEHKRILTNTLDAQQCSIERMNNNLENIQQSIAELENDLCSNKNIKALRKKMANFQQNITTEMNELRFRVASSEFKTPDTSSLTSDEKALKKRIKFLETQLKKSEQVVMKTMGHCNVEINNVQFKQAFLEYIKHTWKYEDSSDKNCVEECMKQHPSDGLILAFIRFNSIDSILCAVAAMGYKPIGLIGTSSYFILTMNKWDKVIQRISVQPAASLPLHIRYGENDTPIKELGYSYDMTIINYKKSMNAYPLYDIMIIVYKD